MTSPTPPQTGHGRDVITWPSSERCTVCTSPWPWQVSQVLGTELPLVPLPWHRSHSTAVSTVTCLVTPVAHSVRSSRIRSSESEPGRTRPMGPREPAPPPKNASKTSPSPPNPPANPPPPDGGILHRVAAEVDDAALLGIGEHLVGQLDLGEARLGRLIGIDVGMQFPSQLAVGAFELRITGVLAHAEQTVIVACHAKNLSRAAVGRRPVTGYPGPHLYRAQRRPRSRWCPDSPSGSDRPRPFRRRPCPSCRRRC